MFIILNKSSGQVVARTSSLASAREIAEAEAESGDTIRILDTVRGIFVR